MIDKWLLMLTVVSVIIITVTFVAIVYTPETREFLNAWVFYRRNALLPAREVVASCERYLVHQTSTLEELEAVWRIDADAYGDDNISFELLRRWWTRYPQGHYLIKRDGRIIGGFGIWPIRQDSYRQLRTGEIAEDEIAFSKGQMRKPGAKKEETWYLSGVVLARKHRKTRALRCLLHTVTVHWRLNQTAAPAVRVGSIPISEDGLRLLMRFGFNMAQNADERKNHHPFYELVVEPQNVQTIIDALRGHD